MINTYNETKLHRTLKELYQLEYNGITEVPVEGYICDVVAESGLIIEVQTKNLGKLLPKLKALHSAGRSVLLIHPLCIQTTIESYSESGTKLSSRKSPKKQNWYTLFSELMGIYSLLDEEWFQLEVPSVVVKEKRIKTDEPVQLMNKSRRFKRNWYKEDRELVEIRDTRRFSGKNDYLQLLPSLPEQFCARDLAATTGSSNAYKIIWVLKKAGFITAVKKEGRTTFYSVTA